MVLRIYLFFLLLSTNAYGEGTSTDVAQLPLPTQDSTSGENTPSASESTQIKATTEATMTLPSLTNQNSPDTKNQSSGDSKSSDLTQNAHISTVTTPVVTSPTTGFVPSAVLAQPTNSLIAGGSGQNNSHATLMSPPGSSISVPYTPVSSSSSLSTSLIPPINPLRKEETSSLQTPLLVSSENKNGLGTVTPPSMNSKPSSGEVSSFAQEDSSQKQEAPSAQASQGASVTSDKTSSLSLLDKTPSLAMTSLPSSPKESSAFQSDSESVVSRETSVLDTKSLLKDHVVDLSKEAISGDKDIQPGEDIAPQKDVLFVPLEIGLSSDLDQTKVPETGIISDKITSSQDLGSLKKATEDSASPGTQESNPKEEILVNESPLTDQSLPSEPSPSLSEKLSSEATGSIQDTASVVQSSDIKDEKKENPSPASVKKSLIKKKPETKRLEPLSKHSSVLREEFEKPVIRQDESAINDSVAILPVQGFEDNIMRNKPIKSPQNSTEIKKMLQIRYGEKEWVQEFKKLTKSVDEAVVSGDDRGISPDDKDFLMELSGSDEVEDWAEFLKTLSQNNKSYLSMVSKSPQSYNLRSHPKSSYGKSLYGKSSYSKNSYGGSYAGKFGAYRVAYGGGGGNVKVRPTTSPGHTSVLSSLLGRYGRALGRRGGESEIFKIFRKQQQEEQKKKKLAAAKSSQVENRPSPTESAQSAPRGRNRTVSPSSLPPELLSLMQSNLKRRAVSSPADDRGVKSKSGGAELKNKDLKKVGGKIAQKSNPASALPDLLSLLEKSQKNQPKSTTASAPPSQSHLSSQSGAIAPTFSKKDSAGKVAAAQKISDSSMGSEDLDIPPVMPEEYEAALSLSGEDGDDLD